MWWTRHVRPWFVETLRPYRVIREFHYLRGMA